jgi:hypothetical protein
MIVIFFLQIISDFFCVACVFLLVLHSEIPSTYTGQNTNFCRGELPGMGEIEKALGSNTTGRGVERQQAGVGVAQV